MPYKCHITDEVARIPVVTNDGRIYDFVALANHLLREGPVSPSRSQVQIETITLVYDFLPERLDFSLEEKTAIAALYKALNNKHPRIKMYQIDRLVGVQTTSEMEFLNAALVNDDFSAIGKLLDGGLHPNMVVGSNGTLLSVAATHGSLKVVKLLLRQPLIDVNDGNALYAATLRGHSDVVEVLLEVVNIDVNQPYCDTLQTTPLFAAAQAGHVGIVYQLLIKAGIKPHQPNITGQIPLQIAAMAEKRDVVRILLEYYLHNMMTSPEIMQQEFQRFPSLIHVLKIYRNEFLAILRAAEMTPPRDASHPLSLLMSVYEKPNFFNSRRDIVRKDLDSVVKRLDFGDDSDDERTELDGP